MYSYVAVTPEEMQEKYSTRENTIDGGYKFLGQKTMQCLVLEIC